MQRALLLSYSYIVKKNNGRMTEININFSPGGDRQQPTESSHASPHQTQETHGTHISGLY